MKKNVLIYPYDIEFAPILRSRAFNSKYNITGIASLRGWGFCKKDAGTVDGGEPIGINVEECFEDMIDQCDTVIFVKPEHDIDFDKYIYPKIVFAIRRNKEIVCLFDNNKLEEIQKLANENNIALTRYDYLDCETFKYSNISSINTPVISILGISENTDKFLMQILIKEQLNLMGYKAILVGSRSYCELLDSIPFPKFMFESGLSESDKIYNFNRFIKQIESAEKPDIIIIGIPGGILPYNKDINNFFGITAFEVMQAVTPDFCILNLYCDLYKKEYFDNIQNVFKYRFSTQVDIFNIINRKIDSGEMFYETDRIRTFMISDENLNRQIDNMKEVSGMYISNVKETDGANKIANRIIEVLSSDEHGIYF